MQTKDQNAANQQTVQIQFRERQENALALFRKESHEFLMKDYLIALKEGFPGLGIRYITYHEPDQTLLISNISNGRLHLLNLATGSYRWYEHHKTTIRKIKYFRGEILTSSWDGSVRATHYHTLKERLVMTEKNMGRCPYFNISPDGKYLYSFSYDSDVVPFGLTNTLRKWSLKTGKLVSELAASGEQKGSARSGTIIIHNGLLYVCGDSGYFRIFDAATERLVKEINEDANFRSMTSLIHHGYLLASDWKGDLHFFNMSTNTFDFRVKASNSGIYCIRVHPDNPNIIFTSSSDGVIRVWEMPGFNLVNTIIVGHHDLWSMVFINNRLLTGDIDGEIRVYDIKDLSNILLKGRLVISNGVFVAQVPESPMFYTNDLNVMDIYRKSDMEKITGKNGEHILGQSNRLSVLRELFGIEDGMPALTDNSLRFAPQLAENAGMNSWPETGNFVQPKI